MQWLYALIPIVIAAGVCIILRRKKKAEEFVPENEIPEDKDEFPPEPVLRYDEKGHEIAGIYGYNPGTEIWICSNCECENPASEKQCCVCMQWQA